ncbi:hypothetical protein WKK05_02150 [Nostoc sp. UHCC 0302]|uniref:hypothetical protein n=1 Tax=Nostoc sp. UHCC 0302 TaxID=3134896 RepID=UPI00311C8C56
MTIARQNSAASLVIPNDNPKSLNLGGLRQLMQLGAEQLQRFWWHSKAYGTILSIILLTLTSLTYLGINWSLGKLLPVLTHRVLSSNQWNIRGSK